MFLQRGEEERDGDDVDIGSKQCSNAIVCTVRSAAIRERKYKR